MTGLPLISIALCTYNGEKYLADQLDTLVNQSYPNKEIVVVDDCSQDQTIEILKKYEAAGQIRLYKNEQNLGFTKNFEKAISLCKGDYIALCDQDDIWSLDKIELQYRNIGDNLLIYHDSEFIDSEGQPLNKKMSDVLNFVEGNNNKPFIFYNCVSGHTILFKRELIDYIFPIPEAFFHDWWIAYAASTIGTITFLQEPLVKYRQHNRSCTDMLKLREKNEKVAVVTNRSSQIATRAQRKEKTDKMLKWLAKYYHFRHNKEEDREFLRTLMELYTVREHSFFAASLLFTLAKNKSKLYYIVNKNRFSPEKYIFRESIGHKGKNIFHDYKRTLKEKFKKIL